MRPLYYCGQHFTVQWWAGIVERNICVMFWGDYCNTELGWVWKDSVDGTWLDSRTEWLRRPELCRRGLLTCLEDCWWLCSGWSRSAVGSRVLSRHVSSVEGEEPPNWSRGKVCNTAVEDIYSSTEHCSGRYIQQYWTLQWKIYSSTEQCSGRYIQQYWTLQWKIYTAVLNTVVEDIYSSTEHCSRRYIQQYWTLQWKIYTAVLNTAVEDIYSSTEHCNGRYIQQY